MSPCVVISRSPDRPNIFYEARDRTTIELDFQDLLFNLRSKRAAAPRAIVYCQSLNMCADIYAHFHYELGDDSYYSRTAGKKSSNRLFAMFHAGTADSIKKNVLESLNQPDGVVRVVIATIALGMGVDLKDTNLVIHYGAPRSIEDYFQESGRGGRRGTFAKSIVYWKPRDCPLHKIEESIRHREMATVRRYLENTLKCRREQLLTYFNWDSSSQVLSPQNCCDVCLRKA